MFRVILRSLEPVPVISHLKRNLTGKKNPFVKAKLPPIPDLEIISARGRDLQELCQTHLSSRKVKHGDFDFLECNEGFILCYIDTLQRNVHPQNIFYGVFYGENHPLNMSGPVNGEQKLSDGRVIGILNAIRNFPEIGPKKLCFCSNCTRTLGMIRRLPIYIENGYRNLTNGRVLESKETYEKLVEVIRLRTDLQLRFLYTSADVVINMKRPLQLATSASRDEME